MRYGHQPLGDLMDLPVEDLFVLAEEIMELVRIENDANRAPSEDLGG